MTAWRRSPPSSPSSIARRYSGTAWSGWPVESNADARSNAPRALSSPSSAMSASILARNSSSLWSSNDAHRSATRCSHSTTRATLPGRQNCHVDPVSRISQAYPDRIEVRGRDLTGDLMGRLSFTEYFHLLLTGEEPAEEQRYFLDLLLVAIAEHGMMPTNVAARMTLAADPESLQGAVAAGILGAGRVILGTSEACARLLSEAQEKVASGGEPATVAEEMAASIRASGERLPGFGHPGQPPLGPRAERILELACER